MEGGGVQGACPTKVGGRGFVGKSLCKASSLLGITAARKRKDICRASEAAEKPLDGCGQEGTSCVQMLLGHRQRTDHSQFGHLGKGV